MTKVHSTTFVNDIGQTIEAGDLVVLVSTGKYNKSGHKGIFRGLVGGGASVWVKVKRSYHFLSDGRRLTPKLLAELSGRGPQPPWRDYTAYQQWRKETDAWAKVHAPLREVDVWTSKHSNSKLVYKITGTRT